ncbi:MAG: hypothetical protein ACRDNF_21975, partial [Streptosporangiaceae bacterium]
AGDERPPPGPVHPGPADLYFSAVDPQFEVLGGGIGEHIGQGVQPQPGMGGHSEAAGRQQRPDLADGPGDRGPVDLVEQARAACGSWNRKITRVAITRSVNASPRSGPAPCARRR